MAITRTAMVDDDGSGTTGTILNNAWKQELYTQIDGATGAVWTNVPFNAANFAGSAPMVWTVGAPAVVTNRYTRIGNVLVWSVYLSWFSGSNVLSGSATPTLKMTLPGGCLLQDTQVAPIVYAPSIAGAQVNGLVVGPSNGSAITIQKVVGGNFTLTDVPGFITTFLLVVV